MAWISVCDAPAVSGEVSSVYLAFAFALNTAGANISLSANTVGAYELFKAMQIPALVAIQALQFRVYEKGRACGAVILAIGFVTMGSVGSPVGFTIVGFCAAVASVVASAAGKVAIKAYSMQLEQEPRALLKAMLPGTIALLGAYAITIEQPSLPDRRLMCYTFMIGICAVLMNITAVRCCAHSPMMYQMLAPLKTLIVVTLASSWGTPVRTIAIVGAGGAALLYIRYRDCNAWAAAPQRSLAYLKRVGRRDIVACVGVCIAAVALVQAGPGKDVYRLGDYAVGVRYEDSDACADYPGSLLCELTKAGIDPVDFEGNIRKLGTIVRDRAMQTVVHVRTGDGLNGPDCFNRVSDCDVCSECFNPHGFGEYPDTIMNATMTALYALPRTYYDNIHPPRNQSMLIVGGAHGAANAQRDRAYIRQLKMYFTLRGYVVRTQYAGAADDDFMLFARAHTLVQGGGGYGGLASRMVLSLGGTVLRSPNVSVCGARHSLCVQSGAIR